MEPLILAILALLVIVQVVTAFARQTAWVGFVIAYEDRHGRRPGLRQLVNAGIPWKAIVRASEDAEIERLRRRYWALSASGLVAFGATILVLLMGLFRG